MYKINNKSMEIIQETNKMQKQEEYDSEQENLSGQELLETTLCPICQAGCRYLYTLSVGCVVLVCDECCDTWLDPDHIDINDAISNETLIQTFPAPSCEYLYNNNNAGWSTEQDIKKSCWKNFVGNKKPFVFTRTYNLPPKYLPNEANIEMRYTYSYLFEKSKEEDKKE